MKTILGIDAGGTYTDCVVIAAESEKVLHKAKTLTTKADLTRCLEACFAGVPADLLAGTSLVCLSTTLATNAIVEGHGCKEGLILIGSKPVGRLPTPRYALVKGKFDVKGRLVDNIDPAQVAEVVESFRGKVDAVAVSGYASVRCPEHEVYVKAVIGDRLGIPVVAAHELTSKLGYYDRTVTAVLNAKLIPMVCELMDSVKSVMLAHGVTAPLMMVRGDGTLVTDERARNKPIETILSGPAASAIGALHLSGLKDCFVMDIGGTTTDIANVSDGRLGIRSEGAKIGGWSTQVRAAEVFTVGLGGDSRIFLDAEGGLRIGPDRSVSYALAALQSPELLAEMEDLWSDRATRRLRLGEQEAYGLVRKRDLVSSSGEEHIVVEALRQAPHTLHHLEQTLKLPGLRQLLTTLVKHGVVERISLTPTDLWHVSGQYSPGDPRAAELAVRIVAEQGGSSPEALVEQVQRTLRKQLDISSIRAAMFVDRQSPDIEEGGLADYFVNRLCFAPVSQAIRASFSLLKPVVAIGAPAATWLGSDRADPLFTARVPPHAEVANAIGAAVAHAVENLEVLIRLDSVSGQYLVFSPTGRVCCATLEEATEHALASGKDFVSRLAGNEGFELESRVEDFEIASLSHDRRVFVERVVTLSARL